MSVFRLSSLLTLCYARTIDPPTAGIIAGESTLQYMQVLRTGHPESASADFHALRQGFIPPTHKPEHQQRISDAYHAFKYVEGFAKVATLDDIRANDGNLSIPLYVRGKGVREEKGNYAADGLKAAIQAWDESSLHLQTALDDLLSTLNRKH